FGPPPLPLRPNEVLLPDVVGRPLAEALQILERAGLRGAVGGEITTRNPQAAGRVSSTTPYPGRGARVLRGSLVRLRVYRLAAQ
ncbi:MAG: PASTA domain-containing protein, partial [Candidatus Tectomicrobia bacterium]|nr:PASTA domain-containing protein [Candidatus Tectomicrobia bacterium]